MKGRKEACPKTALTVDWLLRCFTNQDVLISHTDLLDYGPRTMLGWHQDNMVAEKMPAQTFTLVLTLYADGDGRTDWRIIERSSSGESSRMVTQGEEGSLEEDLNLLILTAPAATKKETAVLCILRQPRVAEG